jgi:HPt (histidine-containing phosphotransfer) domain-containing protein
MLAHNRWWPAAANPKATPRTLMVPGMSSADQYRPSRPYPGATPVCDTEALDRLEKWGGEKLVREMVTLFRAEAAERVSALRTGLRSGALEEVQRAAHTLRSSSGQVGAARMQALCVEVEARAAGGDLTGVAELLASLESELARYEAAVGTPGES